MERGAIQPITPEYTMSGTEKKPTADMPELKVDDATADKVKGGAGPINGGPKPAEPVSAPRKI